MWWIALCDGFALVRQRTIRLASLECEFWGEGLVHADARLVIYWE